MSGLPLAVKWLSIGAMGTSAIVTEKPGLWLFLMFIFVVLDPFLEILFNNIKKEQNRG